jgi:hypothetical protein
MTTLLDGEIHVALSSQLKVSVTEIEVSVFNLEQLNCVTVEEPSVEDVPSNPKIIPTSYGRELVRACSD